MKTVKISVRIPETDYDWLQDYAAKNGLSASDLIREAIWLYIETRVHGIRKGVLKNEKD